MKEQIYKKKVRKFLVAKKLFLFFLYGISHIIWSALSDVANRKKHRSTCAAKRPSRRLPGTVTRLKYNCANFHYFLISTEQQRPLSFRYVHEKIHRDMPHKSHWLSAPDGYSQLIHVPMCIYVCVHQLCFCYIFVVLAWCINTLHKDEKIRCIFTSISPRRFVYVMVFFSSKEMQIRWKRNKIIDYRSVLQVVSWNVADQLLHCNFRIYNSWIHFPYISVFVTLNNVEWIPWSLKNIANLDLIYLTQVG